MLYAKLEKKLSLLSYQEKVLYLRVLQVFARKQSGRKQSGRKQSGRKQSGRKQSGRK